MSPEQGSDRVEIALTERSDAEVVGSLLALRALATELESAFASYDPRGAHSASAGAHAMVETVDRVLDVLDYEETARSAEHGLDPIRKRQSNRLSLCRFRLV